MNKKEKSTVKIVYKYSDDYKNSYVTGLYGGLTPRGQIKMDFFVEYFETIDEENFEILPDGTLGNKQNEENKRAIIREKVTGILIDIENANTFVDWLNGKIKEHQKLVSNLTKKKKKD